MEEVTNRDRANWAYAAVEAFAKETYQDENGDLENDIGTVIGDLLCNLMHLCRIGIDNDKHGDVEFDVLLKNAKKMNKIEVDEDEDD